jgi:hypothetical protein
MVHFLCEFVEHFDGAVVGVDVGSEVGARCSF